MNEHQAPIKLAVFSLIEAERVFSNYDPEIHAPHIVFCVDEEQMRVCKVNSEQEAQRFFTYTGL